MMVVGRDDAGCDGDSKVVEGGSCKPPSSLPREGLISSNTGIALSSGPRLERAAAVLAVDGVDLLVGGSLDEEALIALEEILPCLATSPFPNLTLKRSSRSASESERVPGSRLNSVWNSSNSRRSRRTFS